MQRHATCCVSQSQIIPNIRQQANEKLNARNLKITEMCWQKDVLRVIVDALDGSEGATLDDCTYTSTLINSYLDGCSQFENRQYTLEVSTPGTARCISKDREFRAFKGFPVIVTTKDSKTYSGTLVGRSDSNVRVSVKGRTLEIPRTNVMEVSLSS